MYVKDAGCEACDTDTGYYEHVDHWFWILPHTGQCCRKPLRSSCLMSSTGLIRSQPVVSSVQHSYSRSPKVTVSPFSMVESPLFMIIIFIGSVSSENLLYFYVDKQLPRWYGLDHDLLGYNYRLPFGCL